jgi:hypothetical protein
VDDRRYGAAHIDCNDRRVREHLSTWVSWLPFTRRA